MDALRKLLRPWPVSSPMTTPGPSSVPTGMGGCGLTSMTEIGPLAYEASKTQCGPKDKRLSQDELVTAHYQKVAHKLAESSDQMKLHLEDCAGQGNAAWMESLEGDEIMPDEVTQAKLPA